MSELSVLLSYIGEIIHIMELNVSVIGALVSFLAVRFFDNKKK